MRADGATGTCEVLTRREQLGLRKRKKDVNKAAKGRGKGSALKRKKSGLSTLKKAGKSKPRAAPSASSKAPAAAHGCHEWDDDWGYWEGAWSPEEWAAYEAGWWMEETSNPKSGKRGKGKKVEAKQPKTPPAPKPKAKVGAKAKAAPKAATKAKAKAKAKTSKSTASPKATASDSASSGASKKRASKKRARDEAAEYDESKVGALVEWVQAVNVEARPKAFKNDLKALKTKIADHLRLNCYWSRCSCGLTFKYVNHKNERAQTDVGTFSFENCQMGMALAVACATKFVPCHVS